MKSETQYAKLQKERVEFKALMLENPNYFGTAIDPIIIKKFQAVVPMSGNTSYEELVCVGLAPAEDVLEAAIQVKLPYGFGGGLCAAGTKEYVAFFIDYHDGAGFVSVGAPTDVTLHDIAAAADEPLYYAVRKPFIPKAILTCGTPQIVTVRAILAWESLPTGPGYVPVWGNVLDQAVQIRPKQEGFVVIDPAIVLASQAVSSLKPAAVPMPVPIPVPGPGPVEKPFDSGPHREDLNPQPEPPSSPDSIFIYGHRSAIKQFLEHSLKSEQEIRATGKTEKQRADFKHFIAKNPNYFGSISESKDKEAIFEAVKLLPQVTAQPLLAQLAVDPGVLVPVEPFLLKTAYEELTCVGLYPEDDLLEAVIEIKLPYGFGGDLCAYGGTEYVAFYIDWGSGTFDFVGTGSVQVHDIPGTDATHLFYAVKAKIPNAQAKLKSCEIENTVKVKAILSWYVDPSPWGPNYTPTWGNVLTRRVQIRPTGPSAQCAIEIVNEINVADIATSGPQKGLAIKIDGSNNTVPGTYDRPFGGIIACWGNVNVPGAVYYRFRFSSDGGSTWDNVKDPRTYRNWWGFSLQRYPDPDGWFTKSDYDSDVSNYSLQALVHWASYGKGGLYRLRLEVADAGKNPLSSSEVDLLLDNTGVELLAFGVPSGQLPATGVAVKLGATWLKCGTFTGHDSIRVMGNFRDDYFGGYSLLVFGGNINVGGVGFGSGRYDVAPMDGTGVPGAFGGGPGLQLAVLDLCSILQVPNKVKCAYGIQLWVWDRSIVGYVSGYQFNVTSHGASAFVTFDWDPAGAC